jgi:hypothetical protein
VTRKPARPKTPEEVLRHLMEAIQRQRKKCDQLRRANDDPDLQYMWDDWVKNEGVLIGMELGQAYLRTAMSLMKNQR